MNKAPRTIYSNQERIKKEIFEYLKEKIFLDPFINKVYLLGSLADKDFGIYLSSQTNAIGQTNYGSDVDLIIISDEIYMVPNNWPKKEDYIFEFYDLGFIQGINEIKDDIHRITVFVYRESLQNLPVANANNLKGDVFDMPSRKEALKFWLSNHQNELWYCKN